MSKNMIFALGCIAFITFLSPPIFGGGLGSYWWAWALASLALPVYSKYFLRITWVEWLVLFILSVPFLLLILLMAGLNYQDLGQVSLSYMVSAFILTFSFSQASYKKNALRLKEKTAQLRAEGDSLFIEGRYSLAGRNGQPEMELFSDDAAQAIVASPCFDSFNFSIQRLGEKASYFENSNRERQHGIFDALKAKWQVYRSDYVLKLPQSQLTISRKGEIRLPDGDTAVWDWRLSQLLKGEVHLQSSNNKSIQITLYAEGALCAYQGERSEEMELAIMALMFFLFNLRKRYSD